ncbi:MAG: hypothetical protein WEC84_04110, partial [Candidatus Andersenbacteria bacterium]
MFDKTNPRFSLKQKITAGIVAVAFILWSPGIAFGVGPEGPIGPQEPVGNVKPIGPQEPIGPQGSLGPVDDEPEVL